MTTYCGLNDSREHEHASDCYVPRQAVTTKPVRNEAAERLRDRSAPEDAPPKAEDWNHWYDGWASAHDKIDQSLDAALAAERRATVERLLPVLEEAIEFAEDYDVMGTRVDKWRAILDEEADR